MCVELMNDCTNIQQNDNEWDLNVWLWKKLLFKKGESMSLFKSWASIQNKANQGEYKKKRMGEEI